MNKPGKKGRWKIQRQLGLELPGLGRPGALEKRAYPPGQHGPTSKRKTSGYGMQLREKQKLLFHYSLREEQLRRYVRQAQRSSDSNWMSRLVSMLECRLDNLVFRLGLARSMASARQLASHRHILVNGKHLNIPSAVLAVGDRISISPKAKDLPAVQYSLASPRLPLPTYLDISPGDPFEVGILNSLPTVEHLPFAFNPALVAEYYANRGVK